MHIATALTSDVKLGPIYMRQAAPYLMDDVNAGEVLAQSEQSIQVQPWIDRRAPECETAERLVAILPGGFGDLLFLTPVLAQWRLQHPEGKLYVSCFERCKGLIEDFAEWLPYPLDLSGLLPASHKIVPLEMLVQRNPGQHPVDVFARALGVNEAGDWPKACLYTVRPEERMWAQTNFPRLPDSRTRIGIQVKSSALCRSYPAPFTTEIMSLLVQRGCEIYLFGALGDAQGKDHYGKVTNLTTRNLEFRQSCAVLATCDAVIAPDSSLCHVAGALGLPTVALYGPFPWQERTRHHPSIVGLNGPSPCAPCYYHTRSMTGGFPADGPCIKSKRCEALAALSPRRIVTKVLDLLKTTTANTNPATTLC